MRLLSDGDSAATLPPSRLFLILQAAIKDPVPLLLRDLLAEDTQSGHSSFCEGRGAVRKSVDEGLEVWLKQRQEELLDALEQGGDVRQGKECGEYDLGLANAKALTSYSQQTPAQVRSPLSI